MRVVATRCVWLRDAYQVGAARRLDPGAALPMRSVGWIISTICQPTGSAVQAGQWVLEDHPDLRPADLRVAPPGPSSAGPVLEHGPAADSRRRE